MANKLDTALLLRAVEALLNYEGKRTLDNESQSLLGSYSKPIFAQVQLKKAISKPAAKPVRVKIPYSLFSPGADANDDSICLFCRSQDKAAIDEFVAQNPIEGLKKVISINSLKKEYAKFDDLKKLLKEHTHFLCDHNIVSQLYNKLGKTFLSRHSNSPVAIQYDDVKDLPAAVAKSVSSSYMHMKGTVLSIKLATTIMKSKHVALNIEQGLDFAVDKLHDKWKDVVCIHLKISDSAALPIYTKVQSEAGMFFKAEAEAAAASSPAPQSKSKSKTAPVPVPQAARPSSAKKAVKVVKAVKAVPAVAPPSARAPASAAGKAKLDNSKKGK